MVERSAWGVPVFGVDPICFTWIMRAFSCSLSHPVSLEKIHVCSPLRFQLHSICHGLLGGGVSWQSVASLWCFSCLRLHDITPCGGNRWFSTCFFIFLTDEASVTKDALVLWPWREECALVQVGSTWTPSKPHLSHATCCTADWTSKRILFLGTAKALSDSH